MTIEEKYQTISVMVENGTGVLFQPMTKEYTYIFTVKHNLQFKNTEKALVDKNKEDIVLKDNFGVKIKKKIIDIYPHQTLDISIVKIEYLEIPYFVNLLTSHPINKINFNLYGYPGTRRTEKIKSRLFKLEYNNQPTEDLIVMKNSEGSPQSEIIGCSGGGVFYEEEQELYLLGIERKIDDESGREESNTSLNSIPINKFFEIIESNSNDLAKLAPPFIESFVNFIEDTFPLPNMTSNRSEVQHVLRKCITDKIKVSPIDFLERDDICVLRNNIKDYTNNKLLWIMYLEFLVFCKVIKDYDELNILSIEDIKSDYKFIFGKSKEWTALIPLVMKSNLLSLKSGGTIFIACDSDRTPYKTDIVKDTLINIARKEKIGEWRINSGIDNPYDELKIKHIFNIQTKIMDKELNFDGLTIYDEDDIKKEIKNAVS